MNTPLFFAQMFYQMAVDGCIGDPGGKLAYAYLRVSSAEQAEEGRSGLPRQILHVHDAAVRHGFRVPWEMVYADDSSGFEFEQRPALSALRAEVQRYDRPANALIIENLDRLSRNADWHQGYLLEQFAIRDVEVVFWMAFSSRIERAVIGAIAQEGMEQSFARMREGNLHKARSGRVTARQRAYGYQFVDGQGRKDGNWRKDTHYALHPTEAAVMETIFHKIAYEGITTYQLATYLDQHFTPPGKAKSWDPFQIRQFIKNPLYKGEFIANRFYEARIPKKSQRPGTETQFTTRKLERPADEWIRVSVPAIVSGQVWRDANRSIGQNTIMNRRNARREYLLSGLVKCATCGHMYCASFKRAMKQGKEYDVSSYRCSSVNSRTAAIRTAIDCGQSQISVRRLESSVWAALCNLLLDPELLAQQLGGDWAGDTHAAIERQLKRVDKQIASLKREDEKLYRAFMADAFDEHEFAVRRKDLKRTGEALSLQRSALLESRATQNEAIERGKLAVDIAGQAAAFGIVYEAPFELRRQVVKLLVDQIILDVRGGAFTIEGSLPGNFALPNTQDESSAKNTSVGRGSWRRPAQTRRGR